MKTTTIAFSAASFLLASLIIIGTFNTGIVAALTDATSTMIGTSTPVIDTVTSTSTIASASSSASLVMASSTPLLTNATTTAATSSESLVTGTSTTLLGNATTTVTMSNNKRALKLAHVVGTTYIDYFTDGTKTYALPGDPAVDSKLNLPNAPIPYHSGLKWVSTSGMNAYDTRSGNLDPGTYAQEARWLLYRQCNGAKHQTHLLIL